MKKIILFLLLSVVVIFPSVRADEKAIEKELENFIKAAAVEETDKSLQDSQNQSLLSIQTSIAVKQYSQALNLIQAHIQLNPKTTDAASTLSKVILAELTKQAEEEVNRKKELFKKFADALINAKNIEEIDTWIVKLNEEIKRETKHGIYTQPAWNPVLNFIPNTSSYSSFWSANTRYQAFCHLPGQLQQETQIALRIATDWQDYLHALSMGDTGTASNHMRNIASQASAFIYIPRSKILTLSVNLTPKNETRHDTQKHLDIKDVEHRLKTPEDAVLLYYDLNNHSSSNMTAKVSYLRDQLRKLNEAIDYLNGEQSAYGLVRLHSLKSSPYIGDLANDIFLSHARSVLNLPDDFVINKNDKLQVWVDKYLDQLSKEKKWKELRRAIMITSSIVSRSSQDNPRYPDIDALQLMIAAKNYQEAELYHRAAIAYRQVLGKGVYTQAINDEAASELAKIRKDHSLSYLLSNEMYDHESNSNLKGTESYLKKLVGIEPWIQ